jgi:hypothetical protein
MWNIFLLEKIYIFALLLLEFWRTLIVIFPVVIVLVTFSVVTVLPRNIPKRLVVYYRWSRNQQ